MDRSAAAGPRRRLRRPRLAASRRTRATPGRSSGSAVRSSSSAITTSSKAATRSRGVPVSATWHRRACSSTRRRRSSCVDAASRSSAVDPRSYRAGDSEPWQLVDDSAGLHILLCHYRTSSTCSPGRLRSRALRSHARRADLSSARPYAQVSLRPSEDALRHGALRPAGRNHARPRPGWARRSSPFGSSHGPRRPSWCYNLCADAEDLDRCPRELRGRRRT